MDTDLLQRCVLYKGLSDDEMQYAFEFFHAQERTFKRNEYLHQAGTVLSQFGLLLSGHIQVFMDDFDGNHMIMANVVPGVTFGESLCCLGIESQVYIESIEDSVVLLMDTASLRHLGGTPTVLDLELMNRFTQMLASRTLQMNDRIQILSKLTIREKVITLLSQYASQEGSPVIELPFTRESMATYLGVNQSALSRVLGQMADEGIIRFRGNRFEIL